MAAAQPDFDYRLPSTPHALPFADQWGGVWVVWDLGALQAHIWYDYLTVTAAIDAARAAHEVDGQRLNALPDGPDKTQAIATHNRVYEEQARQRAVLILPRVVLRVDLPGGGKAPDPTLPATWAKWPTAVLQYLTSALTWQEVLSELSGPKLWTALPLPATPDTDPAR